jgi:two-component system, chemotaxis family, sensor kinase CheA
LTFSFSGAFVNIGDYKDVFLTEAREYLSALNNSLVLLEKNQAQTEAIHDIFRAAHSLKGMAATMGYDPMVQLTHQMETILEPIRSGIENLSAKMVDVLFICLDQLEKWVEVLMTQDFIEEESLQSVLQLLRSVKQTQSNLKSNVIETFVPIPEIPFIFSEAENEILSQAKVSGFHIFKVIVQLIPDCVFKEVRAFMILKNINVVGEIIKSNPEPEKIEKGQFADHFTIVVVTDCELEKMKELLLSVSEVVDVKINDFEPKDSSSVFMDRDDSEMNLKTASLSSPGQGVAAEERKIIFPTIRVHTSKLDKLMALVQELVISKIRFEQLAASETLKEISEPLSQLNHITDELQDEIMKVRLMPVKQIFERFPRMIRDLAKKMNKQIDLEMDGAEVELDRTVLEEMSEPLVHLLRNAVDHGIETPDVRTNEGKETYGTIRLQAKRERSYVVISISDDGRGIDPDIIRQKSIEKGLASSADVAKLTDEEVIRLIALPGFSTVENPTEISGRGVGVDVAKTKVETLGGSFRILSKKGQGTTFVLKFPLTLAIIKALLVRCNQEIFAIPVVNIIETLDVFPAEKKLIQQQETIILRGDVIPLYPLQELLDLPIPLINAVTGLETVLVVEVGESRVGLRVDEVIGQQEIAIKSLDRILKGIRGFSGATILGNGKISLILDVNSLIEDLKDVRFQVEHPLSS